MNLKKTGFMLAGIPLSILAVVLLVAVGRAITDSVQRSGPIPVIGVLLIIMFFVGVGLIAESEEDEDDDYPNFDEYN